MNRARKTASSFGGGEAGHKACASLRSVPPLIAAYCPVICCANDWASLAAQGSCAMGDTSAAAVAVAAVAVAAEAITPVAAPGVAAVAAGGDIGDARAVIPAVIPAVELDPGVPSEALGLNLSLSLPLSDGARPPADPIAAAPTDGDAPAGVASIPTAAAAAAAVLGVASAVDGLGPVAAGVEISPLWGLCEFGLCGRPDAIGDDRAGESGLGDMASNAGGSTGVSDAREPPPTGLLLTGWGPGCFREGNLRRGLGTATRVSATSVPTSADTAWLSPAAVGCSSSVADASPNVGARLGLCVCTLGAGLG